MEESHTHKTKCHYLNDSVADVVDSGECAHVEPGLLDHELVWLRGVDVSWQPATAHHEHDQLGLAIPVLGQRDDGERRWWCILCLYLYPEREVAFRIDGDGIQSKNDLVNSQRRLLLVKLQKFCVAQGCTGVFVDSLVADELDVVELLCTDDRCKCNVSDLLLGQHEVIHEYPNWQVLIGATLQA